MGQLTAAAVLLVGAAWWVADRSDRLGNERRLSAVASRIAGREVKVRCPGPLGRLFGWDTVEGMGEVYRSASSARTAGSSTCAPTTRVSANRASAAAASPSVAAPAVAAAVAAVAVAAVAVVVAV